MDKSEDFISKYLTKPNKDGGYKIHEPRLEASRTSDLNELSAFQNHNDWVVRAAAAQNPNCTPAHLDKALDDEHVYTKEYAAHHPNATKENIDKALNDKSYNVRRSAALNPNATSEHLDKALSDKDWSVRTGVLDNPNCTKEHFDRALNDTAAIVSLAASKSPYYKKFYPSGH